MNGEHRVSHIIMLNSKQKHLENMVTEQMPEKEKSNQIMIDVPTRIVEFRNGYCFYDKSMKIRFLRYPRLLMISILDENRHFFFHHLLESASRILKNIE